MGGSCGCDGGVGFFVVVVFGVSVGGCFLVGWVLVVCLVFGDFLFDGGGGFGFGIGIGLGDGIFWFWLVLRFVLWNFRVFSWVVVVFIIFMVLC